MEYISLFIMGFSMSLSHCVGMCGGLTLAYSTRIDSSSKIKTLIHIIYISGRTFAYIILGLLAYAFGDILRFSGISQAIIYIVIGSFILLYVIVKYFYPRLLISISTPIFFHKIFGKLLRSNSLQSFFALGMLNGFIPCGFVYLFLGFALSASNLLDSVIVMSILGLSTMPIMLSIGLLSSFIDMKFVKIFKVVSTILLIFSSIYFIHKGYILGFSQGINTHNMEMHDVKKH